MKREGAAALRSKIKSLEEEIKRLRLDAQCDHDLLLDVIPPRSYGSNYRFCLRCGCCEPWTIQPVNLDSHARPPYAVVTDRQADFLRRISGRDLISELVRLYNRDR